MKLPLLAPLILSGCAVFSGCAWTPAVPWNDALRVYAPMTECAPIGPKPAAPRDKDSHWEQAAYAPVQHTVCWETVPGPISPQAHQELVARCGQDNTWNGNACVMFRSAVGTCWVLSTLTMQEAKGRSVYTRTGQPGASVYEHEEDHCHGWVHPKNAPYSIQPILPGVAR